ncbi:adenine nucleotide alpha hydrolase [Roseisolibacter sp. H3M3-2]|uniref:adenine nucleotide alpha hydrolase n=1 Tax=Roseisolibacter sp. H3M3-2 TaxID=3031323 RepID=UPI0023DC3B58|nr:adenine nucleotide alpha hydrolase [Roseisolibacter sp. H3M3-2]MDF1501834.1 adenine nucleotide alpha hydrolase [Roseisolibacter sp. H3M3-2]
MNPSTPPRALLSWSGGKDSALALHRLRETGALAVEGLLTTITAEYDRISMHGVRRALLEAQAEAVGLPLRTVAIPPGCTNDEYEARTGAALAAWAMEGGQAVAFGDLFLADVRGYRERLVSAHPLTPAFPLWGEDTTALARRFVALGFRAVLVCVDPKQLDPRFAGRAYDDALLDELPAGVDPCGENGEFHTFVWDGPVFGRAVPVRAGEVVERGGFVFADLLPALPTA